MYNLVSALAKERVNGEKWKDVVIGNVPINELFTRYEKVYIVLSNVFLSNNVTLKIASIRTMVSGLTMTFNEFLVSNGNRALPTENRIYTLNTRHAKYADAFHAGYKIESVHPTIAEDIPVPELDKTNLKLTRHGVDYELFYKSCLVNVNGFYHLTDHDTNGIYVVDGMASRNLCKKNQIGITSFKDLGELRFIPITDGMIYKNNDAQMLNAVVNLDIGVGYDDKMVMLVLGGYLHVLDDQTFFRTGDTTYTINFSNLLFLERYYESRNFIDLSSLNLETTSRNPWQVSISDLMSDDVIRAYLTLSQSFLVVLDNSDIFMDKERLHESTLAGMYTTQTKPAFPISSGFGRHVNYWTTLEDGQYCVTFEDAYSFKPMFWTMDSDKQRSVSDQQEPVRDLTNCPAWFVKIGADI